MTTMGKETLAITALVFLVTLLLYPFVLCTEVTGMEKSFSCEYALGLGIFKVVPDSTNYDFLIFFMNSYDKLILLKIVLVTFLTGFINNKYGEKVISKLQWNRDIFKIVVPLSLWALLMGILFLVNYLLGNMFPSLIFSY